VQENSRSRIQKYDIFIQLLTSRIRAWAYSFQVWNLLITDEML
jgi:hypothetical protein